MKRLGPLDKLELAIPIAIWAICFALSVASAVRGVAWSLGVVSVSGGAEGYPILSLFTPWFSREESGLRVGDRLLRLGHADLRGVGPLGFQARAEEEAGPERLVTVVFERAGERGETSLAMPSYAWLCPALLVSFFCASTGVLLYLRARAAPPHALFRGLLCFAILSASQFSGSRSLLYASASVAFVSTALLGPLAFRALLSFPQGALPTGRLARLGPWLFSTIPLVELLWYLELIAFDVMRHCYWVWRALFGVTFLVAGTRVYSRLDSIARRQAKWVLWGVYFALVPFIAAAAWMAADPRAIRVFLISVTALCLVPLSLLIAVARYNLFDVDRLLSATASYNIVLVALVGTGLAVVPRIGELSSELLGIDPRTGQVALSLLLAAVVVPAHQRIRPRIDRVFFKERYALDHGIAELLRALSACDDTRALTQRVGEELRRLLQPEACVVYARAGEAFAPVFVEGRGVPPAFEAGSPLVATLRERQKPLALSASGRRPDAAALGPFDRAALEALQAEVVVPLRPGQRLLAFLCLGPKRSGDVYTSTDLSHLASVAEAVSSQLRRFDQEQTNRQAQEMQDSLRRYVPGAVAEQLASGAELASSQREVSVLFVDIQGYTSFSEARRAEEIFSTVNRYTETVSEIVRKHGGSVVEFNGDGMMAVFGAPRDLPHKERAAVEAGREIVIAVGALPVEDPRAGDARLSVGVGIATGEAFVGNIHAADRMIWSAIGNTTNLAARLQSLTRQLDAAIAIDTATQAGAGYVCADFERHPEVPIRGRSERPDVWVLPLRRPS